MNEQQIEKLISLFHQVIREPDTFTISNTNNISHAWDLACKTRAHQVSLNLNLILTPAFIDFIQCSKKTISVTYKNENLEYDIYIRPLWGWCQELLLDPTLILEFSWDAQWLYKWDGSKFVHFIDEPWTADAWWNYQVS